MDVMASINPPYSNMIFGGIKPMEFRKKVLNEMLKDDPDMDVYPIRRGPRLIIQSDGGECGPTYPLFSGY